MSTTTTRRNSIANRHTLPGMPPVFHPTLQPFPVTFRRPRSRGPEITGLLLGEVVRGACFQHWRVQGEGSVLWLVPNSWLSSESFRAAIASRCGMRVPGVGAVA